MIRLNNKVRRVIAGLVLLVFLTCAANYYFEFHMLGHFDKAALSLCLILLFFVTHFLRPDTGIRSLYERIVASYFLQWTRGTPGHFPNLDFLIGTWGDDTINDRKLVSWLYSPKATSFIGPELLSELRMTLVEQTKHREAALEDPSALVRVQQGAPTLAALIRPS